MKMNEAYVPKALREVWEWKRAIHDEVKHLPRKQALTEILRRAHETAVKYGFAEDKEGDPTHTIAADGSAVYRTRRRPCST